MSDLAAEAFAEFVENREAILLIHNAKKEGFEFMISSAAPDGYHCAFGTKLNNEWKSIGEGNGKTLTEAAEKAWEAVKVERNSPITSRGEWSQALSIAGILVSDSSSYGPLHGCEMVFTLLVPKLIELEALVLECSNTASIWTPRYQLSIQIDGLQVVESKDPVSDVPPNATWRHHMRGSTLLPAGAHMVKLGFRMRPDAGSQQTAIIAYPNTPAILSVRH